jgi:pimeloyl-ACP methyl ester carboxylesterase
MTCISNIFHFMVSVTVVMVSSLMTIPAHAQTTAPCAAPAASGYFPDGDKKQPSAIVFVHGVTGDPVTTWAKSADVFWPCLMREKNSTFQRADIFLYGFVSERLSPSPTIDEAANRLFTDLQGAGLFKAHSHIAFVAHSLGGLIVSRMVLLHSKKEGMNRVRLVYFYGTPAKGASAAGVAKFFSNNIQFKELSDGDSLAAWAARWRAESPHLNIRSRCAVETKGMSPWYVPSFIFGGDLLVREDSASALCDGKSEKLSLNHSDMVKPRSSQDDPFLLLRNSYSQCIAPKLSNGASLSVANSPQGKEAIAWLHALQQSYQRGLAPGSDVVNAVKSFLNLTPSSGWWSHYFAPKTGLPTLPTLAPTDYDYLKVNEFAVYFREQMQWSMQELVTETIVPLSKFSDAMNDSDADDFRNRMFSGGDLDDDDLVMILRNTSSPADQRVLLFLKKASADYPNARLRGFGLVPEPSQCLP